MKPLLCGAILLALAIVAASPTMAQIDINVGISLPPPVVFQAPPEVIVMPDTSGVYVVPDVDAEMFFWNGWWWRLWNGYWYRSHYYDRGWGYYRNVPSFYYDVDPGWRGYYGEHNWHGHRWADSPDKGGDRHNTKFSDIPHLPGVSRNAVDGPYTASLDC